MTGSAPGWHIIVRKLELEIAREDGQAVLGCVIGDLWRQVRTIGILS